MAISGALFAQVPQKFNYQGIARDTKGNPMAQQRMTLKLTVLPTSDATEGEYEEIQSVTTNEFGLYNLQIGNGTPVKGEMKTVKWETGNKYIKVAIDPKGGNDFVDAGTTQLLSVPYAIYADKAGMAKNTGSTSRATNNFIEKTNGSGVVNSTSQIFDNGTNIGIGTTTPSAKFHINQNVAGVQEHMRMQNLSTTGAGRFTLYSDGASNYSTFTKYGSAFAGNYVGLTGLYPNGNLLAFGNNGLASGDGLGRFLISSGGNVGISMLKGGTSKLKFHADFTTENVGIGGNAAPVSRVHLNNTDGTTMDVRLTNTTTGQTATDGMTIAMTGNSASINNRENAALTLGTNNTTRMTVTAAGNVEVANQIQIAGGAPGVGKVLTSDATGLATWQTPSGGGGSLSGSGTLNYIPKFTPNGTTLGNSGLIDNGGLIYNGTSMPDSYTGLFYQFPTGTNASSANIHTPSGSTAHNYINLTSNSINPWQGIHFADSAQYYTWFNTLVGGDSVGSLYFNKSQNKIYLGDADPNSGLQIQVDNGRMGNNIGNAHFNINTTYDTAGHFTSSSSNSLNNGILRAEYTGTATFDHVAVLGKATPVTGWGIGTSGEGNWIGIRGLANTGGYAGVYGYGYGNATGISGVSENGTAVSGSISFSNNPSAIAVYADASFAKGIGVRAIADSNQAGVFTAGNGNSSPALENGVLRGEYTGTNIQDAVGVYGKSTPPNSFYGIGVKGEGNYYGVQGVSADAYGVYGLGNYGVYGEGSNGSTVTRFGIYGLASGATTNYAGYFSGTLYATTGTFGTKPFMIDHPLDPTNKFLRHSSIESNDMMNLYNGNITTDANGYATVEMPDYFEALNENFKYQLTVIGTFAQAIIKEEITNNKFVIQTSQPNVKVSWQVSGVRHDAVAKKYPVIVEEMKPEGQKGLYLEPEAFGQPKEMGANNPDRINKEKQVNSSFDYKADTERLREKSKADRLEMQRREELKKEAQKNWKQQEVPKSNLKGTTPSFSRNK